MKNSVLMFLCLAFLGFACSNTKEAPSGFKYTVVRKGDGVLAKSGQIFLLDFLLKNEKDSIISDSKTNPTPTMLQAQDSVQKGDVVTEVIQLLSKGDSVTFQVSAKLLFQGQGFPPGIDSTDLFNFFIGVKDIMAEDKAREIQNEFAAKQSEKAMLAEMEQLRTDTTLIVDHLKKNSIVAQQTPSGLRYVITKAGTGENAKSGQQVKVNYAGFLLDGTCFDSSIESVARANNVYNEMRKPYQPLEVILGYQQVIPGWEEALGLMNKGSKMTVFIPSTLAYGSQRRSEVIAENSILKFDMEMLDIK